MLIEHTFVTTLESNQAMSAASEFLSRGGFVAEAQNTFELGQSGWTTLQMRRGRRSFIRAKDASQCPQQVRLEWDRGRVAVAATIDVPANRAGNFTLSGGVVLFASRRTARRAKDYTDLMMSLSRGLELLLVKQVSADDAGREWFELEARIKADARRARIRSWVYLGIFLAVVVGVIILIAVNANQRR